MGMMVRSTRRADRARLAVAVLAPALLLGVVSSRAEAAIVLVQTVGPNATKTAGTTLTVTLGAGVNVPVGDTLFVNFAMDPATGAVTCTDSKGNTYTKDADIPNGSGTTGV